MRKNIFCVDLDDTLCYTGQTIIEYAKHYDITNLNGSGKIDQNSSSTDHYYFARMLGWNRKQLIEFFDACYPMYLENIKVKDDAIKLLQRVKELDYIIHIVTARREKKIGIVYDITKKWLEENNLIYDDLIIDCINKGEYVKSVNAQLFLDDSLKNCLDVYTCSPETDNYLLTTNYNKEVSSDKIKRVNDLDEFYEKVRRLKL